MPRGCAERRVFTQRRWGHKPVPATVENSPGVPLKSKVRGWYNGSLVKRAGCGAVHGS